MVTKKADLYEWIKPLDAIDAALNHLLDAHPSLLLIGRQKEPRSAPGAAAASAAAARSVPVPAVEAVRTILRFLSGLLRNSYNKAVFNSLPELSDLLAAADETVSALALDALCQLSIPPLLHRQQQPRGPSRGNKMTTTSSKPPPPCPSPKHTAMIPIFGNSSTHSWRSMSKPTVRKK